MADVGARSIAPAGNPLHEPGFRDDIEGTAETIEDFDEIWDDITTSMEELLRETEPEARLTLENEIKAYAAKFVFPDKVKVTRESFTRRTDLDSHVRTHFETLAARRDDLRTSLGWTDDELLDVAELVYLSDAVFRFVTVTTFEPTDEKLETIQFNRYPEEAPDWVATWIEKVEIMWSAIRGDRPLDTTTEGLFEELYPNREDFITAAKEADIYLPISTERTVDPEETRANIKRRLRRGSPSPRQLHEYCYSVSEAVA